MGVDKRPSARVDTSDQEDHASSSKATIDRQSVKSAAGVHDSIQFDNGKRINGSQPPQNFSNSS